MSSQSSASTIRLVVLLAILALVGFSWYNDVNNVKPKVDQLTDKIWQMADPIDGPYNSDKVQQEIGFKPAKTFKVEDYTVEEYKMSRTIPFLSFHSMYVIYDKHGDVFKIAERNPPTIKDITGSSLPNSVVQKEAILPRPVAAMGGGAPPSPKEDEKKEPADKADQQKDEEEAEKKTEEQADDKAAAPAEGEAAAEPKPDQAPPAAETPADQPVEGGKKDGGDQPKEGDGG